MTFPMAEDPPLDEINVGSWTNAVTFSANGDYLVGGGTDVRVWRVKDGEEVAKLEAKFVLCLAVSNNDRWLAAGSSLGMVFIWDANTYRHVFSYMEDFCCVNGVDFSPDSNRLIVASDKCTASVWNIANRKRVVDLSHKDPVTAARYSLQGDEIATATQNSVRIYDSNNGNLLHEFNGKVTSPFNTGLLWSSDQLFIVSGTKIKQVLFGGPTGSAVLERQVPAAEGFSCIALSQHGDLIAYSANRTVMFWDTSTQAQRSPIQLAQDICSIALSPDGRFLAISREDRKFTIKSLSRITDPPLSYLHPTFQELHVDGAVLDFDLWNHEQLQEANTLLTTAIDSSSPTHQALATRVFVRARLDDWGTAIRDAEKSIEIQPSVIGYIAKSVALVNMGEKDAGYRACDIAIEHFHSTHTTFLLLIKAVIVFMAGEHNNAISRLDDLIAAVSFNSICYAVQAYMYLLVGNSYMETNTYKDAIESFEHARTQVRYHASRQLRVISLIFGWKFDNLDITIQQRLCEALYKGGRVEEGGKSLLSMTNTFSERIYTSPLITEWVSDFTCQCLSTRESKDNTAPVAAPRDEATMPHPNFALAISVPLLREWVKSTLARHNWQRALSNAADFTTPRFTVFQAVCECLETTDPPTEAVECFNQMNSELTGVTAEVDEWESWATDFKLRCAKKFKHLGDAAASAQQYENAITWYSEALSLSPSAPEILIERSKAYLARGLCKEALSDAKEAIDRDQSSPWGYEREHAVLLKAKEYKLATHALKTMFSKMPPSSSSSIPECSCLYVDPTVTEEEIQKAIQKAIVKSPQELISTDSRRLLDKSGQESSFKSQPIFWELVSSMTRPINQARIEEEVAAYYYYAMLSHKWGVDEPRYEEVKCTGIDGLGEYPTHQKLRMFCKIVKDNGIHWAWSDTCCINKHDRDVRSKALRSMFRWYQGSAVTIVFLCDVDSPPHTKSLWNSVWNERAWTFQEYHASKVVRFYTSRWTPYLDLNIHNHKESARVVSEMAAATNVSEQALKDFRPGLGDVRMKLRMVFNRQATEPEDTAFSLLGIFSATLSTNYGDDDKVIGELLTHLLGGSRDTSILAWTGKSGSYNSCLPTDLTVFGQSPTTHIPLAVEGVKLDTDTSECAMKLYDRLHELRKHPLVSSPGNRLELPCIRFKLGPRSRSENDPGIVRARTDACGIVKIRTGEDLARPSPLYLVHPWIDVLLDQPSTVGSTGSQPEENADDQSSVISELQPFTDRSSVTSAVSQTSFSRRSFDRQPPTTPLDDASVSSSCTALHRPPSIASTSKEEQARRLVARLGQEFGALLLAPYPGVDRAYRRVVSESSIMVQVGVKGDGEEKVITREILETLLKDACILNVL